MKRLPPIEVNPPALWVSTLGRVEVLVAGKPAQWHAQAAEELFFYLMSYPQGRSKDQILEQLWGLDPTPVANNRFRVTVFRIRSALANPWAIVEEHGRYRLAGEIFQASDLYEFYRAITLAHRTQDEARRLEGYREAIAIYKGDYLSSLATNWVAQVREEHKAVYVQALLEVALTYSEQENWPAAAEHFRRATQADPYVGENYHQQLMRCLAASGDAYGAIEHYRRFIKFLREELDDTPMPQTRALAEQIKRGECNPSPANLIPVLRYYPHLLATG